MEARLLFSLVLFLVAVPQAECFSPASIAKGILSSRGRSAAAAAAALTQLRGGMKPVGFSAKPGTLEKEEQKVLSPLGADSQVLVVGASRGIGLEFASQLLEKGCSVVGTHRGDAVPQQLKELKDKSGDRLRLLAMDVGDEESINSAASELRGLIKGGVCKPLSHIIHNAGVYGPKDSFDGKERNGRMGNPPVTKSGLMSTFEINAVGPLLVASAFTPLVAEAKGSKTPILAILTSKVGSVDDNMSGGAYAYRASKSALNIITKSLFCDLAGSVAVLLLHPGYVRTDMTGGQGLIDVDESVSGMLKAIEATDGSSPFRWVDFKACRIPW